jgi:hypothetical protein
LAGPRCGVPSLPDSVSLLSVDAVDRLLSDFSFCIGSEDWLFEWIVSLGADYLPLLRHVQWDRLSQPSGFETAVWAGPQESVWAGVPRLVQLLAFPAPAGFASLIVSQFPGLFAEFDGKRFALLWRGSRDGFGASDFHGRCDGHANTLTIIEDTKGNIFGGFTPVEWESGFKLKADPSLNCFLFTLKNPHNFPARKFALKAAKKDEAIYCNSSCGPHFRDIGLSDNCNANTDSGTSSFGRTYANDAGLAGATFFTGSERFKVKEIEVFEITD